MKHILRLTLIAASLIGTAASAVAQAPATRPGSAAGVSIAEPEPVSGPIPLCLWTNSAVPGQPGFDPAWDLFVSAFGRKPTMFMLYQPVNDRNGGGDHMVNWPANIDGMAAAYAADSRTQPPSIPVIGVGLGSTLDGPQFSEIVAGKWDSVYTANLESFRSRGYNTIYLRPGWEMNAGFPWKVSTANAPRFVAAFQHVTTLARKYAAQKGFTVKIVWNPNVAGNPGGNAPYLSYYPGAGFVDIIAIDEYSGPVDRNWAAYGPRTALSDPTMFTVSSMIGLAVRDGKSIAFGEIGGSNLDSKTTTAFINQVVEAMNRRPAGVRLDFMGLYADPPWHDGSDPAALAAWRAGFGPNGSVHN
jgi:hypothetical protein